ncbi:MAG: hypothetical protein ACLFUE_11380 [Desulfobacteraceae bacterium]
MIVRKTPATLELVFCSSIIIILISIPVGTYAGVRPESWISGFLMGAGIVGVFIPVFLTAIMLIYLFAAELNWLPS